VIRAEVRTGPSGPVFFLLLLLALALLAACAPRATQSPTFELSQVHDSGAHRIAFDPASRRLASGGLRGYIRIWSLANGAELHRYKLHRSRITGLAWLDGMRVISADRSGLVVINDLASRRVMRSAHLDRVNDLAVSTDRNWLIIMNPGGIRRLSLPGLEMIAQRRLPAPPLALAIAPAGDRIAVADRDGHVRLLDTELKTIRELPRPSRKVQDLVFSPDGNTLLGGGWFKLLAWDLSNKQLQEYPTEHLGKINSVAISPDGAHWLSLGRETDSQFLMTSTNTHQVERRFRTLPLCGQRARFSSDGRYAASSSDDGSVHIYDLSAPYRPRVPYFEND
jgi:WD40 repeat protein